MKRKEERKLGKKEIEKKIGKEGRKQVSLKKEVRRLLGKKGRKLESKEKKVQKMGRLSLAP